MREQLKTCEKYSRDHCTGRYRITIRLPNSVIFLCPVIESPDWLTALGNTNTDCHKHHINFGNNTHTCDRDITSIDRISAIISQNIIQHDLHNRHRDLINTGRKSQRNDCTQI